MGSPKPLDVICDQLSKLSLFSGSQLLFPPVSDEQNALGQDYIQQNDQIGDRDEENPENCPDPQLKTTVPLIKPFTYRLPGSVLCKMKPLPPSLSLKEKKEFLFLNEALPSTIDLYGIKQKDEFQGALIPHYPILDPEMRTHAQSLTIFKYKNAILTALMENQVVMISGGIASGKSTQVPQYILENAAEEKCECYILCCEPYPIMATSLAERIATERGERVGNTVGYQIPLETSSSPCTNLTYVTPPILINMLMHQSSKMSKLTHIIIDTVNERDRFTDFILIALRNCLSNLSLKLILIHDNHDTVLLSEYFKCRGMVRVEDTKCNLQIYHLEDIISMTSYMRKVAESEQFRECNSSNNSSSPMSPHSVKFNVKSQEESSKDCVDPRSDALDPIYVELRDRGSEVSENVLLNMMKMGMVFVNHRHCETGMTLLMIAAEQGKSVLVEILLSLGADVTLVSKENLTAMDYAQQSGNVDTKKILQDFISSNEISVGYEKEVVDRASEKDLTQEQKNSLLAYYRRQNTDNLVVYDLIIFLVLELQKLDPNGDMVIFLPSFRQIIKMKDALLKAEEQLTGSKWVIYSLYPDMQMYHQKVVFKNVHCGYRRIILATDMAAHCITSDVVRYVIDCGKIEQTKYNNQLGIFTTTTTWATKKCLSKRHKLAARGHFGTCYRLYPKVLYSDRKGLPPPDMRCSPLMKLCLYTKMVSPDVSIVSYLEQSIQPPLRDVVEKSISDLKRLEALDNEENLTPLGQTLMKLPIEPQYGKMILTALVLKCLDPVLTAATCLSYKVIPDEQMLKSVPHVAAKKWAEISDSSYSDHSVLIKAFLYISSQGNGGKIACEKFFVNPAVIDLISTARTNIVGHLRLMDFVKTKGDADMKDLNSNSEKWCLVKAALATGHYPNIAYVDRTTNKIRDLKGRELLFHPQSVLLDFSKQSLESDKVLSMDKIVDQYQTDFIMFDQGANTSVGRMITTCSLVSPITLLLFVGPSNICANETNEKHVNYINNEGMPEVESDDEDQNPATHKKLRFAIDKKLQFFLDPQTFKQIVHYRIKWFSYLDSRLKHLPVSQCDSSAIKVIISMLEAEDRALHLKSPKDFGKKPQAFTVNIQEQNRRCFIVRSDNINNIVYSLNSGYWKFEPRMLVKIMNLHLSDCPVVLFFVLKEEYFCGYGLFGGTKNGFMSSVHWLKEAYISAQGIQLTLPYSINLCDGEEIDGSTADTLFNWWCVRLGSSIRRPL